MTARDEEVRDFVAARGHALLRSAYLLTGDQHLAEDLVQVALARSPPLLESRPQRQRRGVHPQDHVPPPGVLWRRRRVPESMPGDLPEPRGGVGAPTTPRGPAHPAAGADGAAAEQRAVWCCGTSRTSPRPGRRLLGISVGTVKSQAHKALDAAPGEPVGTWHPPKETERR